MILYPVTEGEFACGFYLPYCGVGFQVNCGDIWYLLECAMYSSVISVSLSDGTDFVRKYFAMFVLGD